jgi:hypothetical protein
MATPFQKVEEARRLLNIRVEELQRNNGINRHYDLSVGAAIDMIHALDPGPRRQPHFTPHRRVMVPGDREVINKARWHPASKLSVYLDRQSAEYQRDSYQFGVYVLVELTASGEIPRYVSAIPRYVGMSSVLSERLTQHARGNSIPGELVTKEWLMAFATEAEQAAYATADRTSQREIRKLCMARRDLWVRTTHTADKEATDTLEHALIRKYEEQGYLLWNHIKYSAGT